MWAVRECHSITGSLPGIELRLGPVGGDLSRRVVTITAATFGKNPHEYRGGLGAI